MFGLIIQSNVYVFLNFVTFIYKCSNVLYMYVYLEEASASSTNTVTNMAPLNAVAPKGIHEF